MVHRYTKSLRISVGTARAEESYRSYPFQIKPSLITVYHLHQYAYVHMVRY